MQIHTNRFWLRWAWAVGLVSMTACSGTDAMPPSDPMPPAELPLTPSSPQVNPGFLHEGAIDGALFSKAELPPAESEKLHSCGKLRTQTLRRILVSRGVSLSTGGMATLMLDADQILGVANFSGRLPESDRNATGSLTRLYDILIAAAVQLVPDATTDRLGTSPACRNERLFNADGSCNADGFGCLVGTPVSQKEMERCGQLSADAAANTNPTNGRRLAVAAVAATYFLCD